MRSFVWRTIRCYRILSFLWNNDTSSSEFYPCFGIRAFYALTKRFLSPSRKSQVLVCNFLELPIFDGKDVTFNHRKKKIQSHCFPKRKYILRFGEHLTPPTIGELDNHFLLVICRVTKIFVVQLVFAVIIFNLQLEQLSSPHGSLINFLRLTCSPLHRLA